MQSATDRMSVQDLLLITQDHPVKAASQIASIVQKVVPETFHQHKLNSVVFWITERKQQSNFLPVSKKLRKKN